MLLSKSAFTQRNILIIRITLFFWLIAKLISFNLWMSDRLFPVIPPLDFLSAPPAMHLGLFVLSIISMIGLFIFPNRKIFQIILIITETISCLLDQNRWQPWEYQYILTILIFTVNWKSEKNIQSVLVFMLAGIYFYSGLSKLNPLFVESILSKLILSQSIGLSNKIIYSKLCIYTGFSISIIEMIFAIGLFFKRTIKWAAILLIMMHILIILVFGPLGLNYDAIVWPWNLTMISYLIFLILKDADFSVSIPALRYRWNLLFVVLFGLMPALNYIGCWDYFLSYSLFSSKPPDMYVCVEKNNPAFAKLYPYCSENKIKLMCDSNSAVLNIRTWSFKEMKVPACPQMRVYKKIEKKLLSQYPALDGNFFVYVYKNGKKGKRFLK